MRRKLHTPKEEGTLVHTKACRDLWKTVAREGASEESGSRNRLKSDPEDTRSVGLVSLGASSVTTWMFCLL